MGVLLFLHRRFLEPGTRELDWLNRFTEALPNFGIEAERFGPGSGRIPPGRVVHVFSRWDAETWDGLRRLSARVIVTPGLLGPVDPTPKTRVWTWLRRARRLHNPHTSSVDEFSFRAGAELYLPVTEAWETELRRGWSIDPRRIALLSRDPRAAGAEAAAIYRRLGAP